MNEPKHTPGPWSAFFDVVNNHTNILKIGKTTDLLFSLPGHDKHDPNVRLITAAPELLEALEEAVEIFGENSGSWDGDLWLEIAKNAIAKARGEQS